MTGCKRWIRAGITAVLLAVLLDLLSARQIRVTKYTVSCDGLPETFSGFRIALISDLHGAFLDDGGAALTRAVSGADIIAVTGDLFDRNTQLEHLTPAMEALCQTAPVYYVSGNHEWTVDCRQEVWADMRDAGVIFLENEWIHLTRQDGQITLIGIQDPNGPADRKRPETVMEEASATGSFSIVLYHRNTEPQVWGPLGANLVLSGHGHGGLVRLPWIGGLADTDRGLFPRYDGGIYQVAGATLAVSRGLGNNPGTFRLFNGPEILMLTLVPG